MAGGWSRLFGWGLAGFWFFFFRSLANPSEWVRVVSSLGSSVPDLFVFVYRLGSVRSLLFDASGTSLVSSCVISGGVSFGVCIGDLGSPSASHLVRLGCASLLWLCSDLQAAGIRRGLDVVGVFGPLA
ncbi:hypothetical protein YC2023_032315 [Brassica napus]